VSYETALSVQRLKALGKQQGFLTYEQVNLQLPPSVVDPEEIAAIVEQIERSGVRVIENSPAEGNT
jgi:RNA polymerase primary sigma factor